MDTNLLILAIQILALIITSVYVILVYQTLKNNEKINQRILFNEIVKQERELRIKLNEYREEIHRRIRKKRPKEDWRETTLDYDTLLFNYYEYLAICLYKNSIVEGEAKKYFLELLKDVKEKFDYSILFEEGFAKREQYPGIRWLFKKWNIEY